MVRCCAALLPRALADGDDALWTDIDVFVQALPGQETPDGVPNFKMVLVGDGGTGALRPLARVRTGGAARLSRVC